MKTIKIFHTLLTGLLLLVLVACNKGAEDYFYKSSAAAIQLSGYNGGSENLIVKIDTIEFINNPLRTRNKINESIPYIFPEKKDKVQYTIKEQNTGKLVWEGELKKGDIERVHFIYLLGKITDLPVLPPVEEGKVKMYYMFTPTVTNYSGLIDIEAIRIDNISGTVEKIGRINNVKPNEFTVEPLTFSTFKTGIQEINGVRQAWNLYLRIYKAGTNEYYTQGTAYTWHENSSNPGKAAAGTASSTVYIVGEAPQGTQMRFTTIYSQ